MRRIKPKRPRDLLDVLIDPPASHGPGEDEDAYRPPVASTSWRSRRDGPAFALAVLGVAFGFILLIVPGVLAWREVNAWREGLRFRPRLAWALGGTAIWAVALLPLMFSAFAGVSLVVGVLVLPIVVRVAARG